MQYQTVEGTRTPGFRTFIVMRCPRNHGILHVVTASEVNVYGFVGLERLYQSFGRLLSVLHYPLSSKGHNFGLFK